MCRTSSTLGLVLSFTIACLYTARGLMVNRCRRYSPAKATSAAAKAWNYRHKGIVGCRCPAEGVAQAAAGREDLTRKPSSAIVSERFTKIEATPNRLFLRACTGSGRTF